MISDKHQIRIRSWSFVILALAFGLAMTMAVLVTARSLAADDIFTPSFIEASQPTLSAGQKLTYSIHLLNNSFEEATANVSDKIPAELSYLLGSASEGSVYHSDLALLTWDNVKVPGLGHVVLTFDVTPTAAVSETMDVVNKVSLQVIGADGKGEISNRAVTIQLVPGEAPPEVNAYKTASQSNLAPGQTLTYTILVTNSTSQTVSASISDPLSVDLNYIDGSATGGGVFDPIGRILSWRSVDVPSMSQAAVTFDVTPVAQSVETSFDVVNVASVIYNDVELRPAVTITIVPVGYQPVIPPIKMLLPLVTR